MKRLRLVTGISLNYFDFLGTWVVYRTEMVVMGYDALFACEAVFGSN